MQTSTKINHRLSARDRETVEHARRVLRDVDSTDYGTNATALSWDISALSGAAHVILAVLDKIGGQR